MGGPSGSPVSTAGHMAGGADPTRDFHTLKSVKPMIDQITAIGQSFNVLPHLGALVVAYLLALPIGWDREKSERSAGLRTFPLVAIASCGFIQATENLTAGNPEATARIVEGLITGMGFIGGGAIQIGRAHV